MRKDETVKLISAEGFEFVIPKEAAMVSHTIRNMLTSPGGFAESQHGEVTFPEITAPILEKICQYFHWSLNFARAYTTVATTQLRYLFWSSFLSDISFGAASYLIVHSDGNILVDRLQLYKVSQVAFGSNIGCFCLVPQVALVSKPL